MAWNKLTVFRPTSMLRPSRVHFPSSSASPLHSSHMTRAAPCVFCAAHRVGKNKPKKHRCVLLPTAAAAFKRRAAALHPINTRPVQLFLSPWRRPRRPINPAATVHERGRRYLPKQTTLEPTLIPHRLRLPPERARLCS